MAPSSQELEPPANPGRFTFFLFIPIIFIGEGVVFGPSDAIGKFQFYMFFVLWVQFYACLQFFVTTVGVYELADLYGTYCAGLRKDEENRSTLSGG
jgi:hypothetical protein